MPEGIAVGEWPLALNLLKSYAKVFYIWLREEYLVKLRPIPSTREGSIEQTPLESDSHGTNPYRCTNKGSSWWPTGGVAVATALC